MTARPMTARPTCLALVGAPEAGKTTVQGLLERLYGIEAADDSRPIRDIAIMLYGLDEHDVATAAGKAAPLAPRRANWRDGTTTRTIAAYLYGDLPANETVEVCGVTWTAAELFARLDQGLRDLVAWQEREGDWTVRKLLGEIGNVLEAMHGDHFIPQHALRQVERPFREAGLPVPLFSYGSVRRDQGLVFLRHGGIVVEIVRAGKEPRHEFDRYDRGIVTVVVRNDVPETDPERPVLCAEIVRALSPWLGSPLAAAARAVAVSAA